jgi:hypothetical protein
MKRDDNGKFTNARELITLDRDKKYMIIFVNKTRNDEDNQTLVYEFNGNYNVWKEIGFCTVYNDHQ